MGWSWRIPLSEAGSPGYRVQAVVDDGPSKLAIGLEDCTVGRGGARGGSWAGAGTGVVRRMGVNRYGGREAFPVGKVLMGLARLVERWCMSDASARR